MIVITNPIAVENEINCIHSLFEEGMELLHIRKPDFTEAEMKEFLSKIKSEFRNRLVLHQHHQLAEDFGIGRIHFSRKDRNSPASVWNPAKIKSTSVHSINYFNDLSLKSTHAFDYAFLSPVYPSISKPDYVSKSNLIESVKQRSNFSTKLIALGGITHENIREVLENGFDDIALLGTIWNSSNPIENFKQCQQIALSYSL
ncbi:MAG: thiamine phosphate synthase [Flavobacterium sp.]